MLKKIIPNRIVRFLILAAIIIAIAMLVISQIAGEKHDDPTIPPFTAECIAQRSQVVNNKITDLNCSLENSTLRKFYSVSDEYLKELTDSIPVKKAIFTCKPFALKSYVGNQVNMSHEEISEKLLNSTFDFEKNCYKDEKYQAKYAEINYVDKINSPVIVLSFELN